MGNTWIQVTILAGFMVYAKLKEVKQGEKIPPIRPIASNSSATIKQISSFIDTHARSQVKSFVEDTPHLLRLFETMNAEGPKTEGTFPVFLCKKYVWEYSK